VVIVHSSDLHVGDDYATRLWGGDDTRALRAVLSTARIVGADVVLLAGDVFEHNRLPGDVLDRSGELLANTGMPVVILPGNHDPVVAGSVYHRSAIGRLLDVHVFGVTDDESVILGGLDLEVWGHAHRDYDDMVPLRKPRPRSTRWQIAMAHGHYQSMPDRSIVKRPAWLIGKDEIAATGADYLALGHWNRPARVGNGRVPAYYSGSPEFAGTVNVVRLTAGRKVRVRRRRIPWRAAPAP
jgi:DNA repair exonuclease SbcCD nuclease subunit